MLDTSHIRPQRLQLFHHIFIAALDMMNIFYLGHPACRQSSDDHLSLIHIWAVAEDLEKVFSRFPRLRERRRQLAGTLSGGEQQMLAIGRALMSKPRMLLLDEPSMGLSPILVQEIFDCITEVNRDGTTVLLVEQNAKMALSISDRAYVLETGTLFMEGSAEELLNNDEVKQAYLGA